MSRAPVKSIAVLGFVVAGVLGSLGLAELTQNRPDPVAPGTATVVTFDVATRDYSRGDDAAARALWAVCSATVGGDVDVSTAATDAPGYTFTISPAIGGNGRKRLMGCLEDATLDRVVGHVQTITSAG